MNNRPVAPDAKIYQLGREWDFWIWLCVPCLGRRKAIGWQVRAVKEPPHPIHCDDCPVPF